MKKRREKMGSRSQTLPASPSHSFSNSSSSEFEFTVSHSPRATTSSALCPADDLFYKGLLLPLHLSPRLSMVRTLLSSSSSAAAARDSTASSSTNDSHSSFSLVADCDSSRPSSVTEDDEFKSLNNNGNHHHHQQMKKNKYFSLSRFSSVFKKENSNNKISSSSSSSSSSVKKMSTTAKEVIRKYLKKVKPLMGGFYTKTDRSEKINSASTKESSYHGGFSHSFSGNLRYPKRRSCVSSCPSSMRSSPTHSGVLTRNGFQTMGINTGRVGPGGGNIGMHYSDMEELQSAIQGAIAHCKNSLLQNKSTVLSNEI